MVEMKKAFVERFVEQCTKMSIEMYGVTICLDGWFNVTIRPLMNVMLVSPINDVFFWIH